MSKKKNPVDEMGDYDAKASADLDCNAEASGELYFDAESGADLDYDGIFKDMLGRISSAGLITFINALFNHDFPLDSDVKLCRTETVIKSKSDTNHKKQDEKKEADLVIEINKSQFHIEIQTNNDSEMSVRMFVYGFRIAMQKSNRPIQNGENINLTFPEGEVIYLRSNKNTPKTLELDLSMPYTNEKAKFIAHCTRLADYTAEEILSKKLVLLAQFYAMKYDNLLKSTKHSEACEREFVEEISKIAELLPTIQGTGFSPIDLEAAVKALLDIATSVINRANLINESEVKQTMENLRHKKYVSLYDMIDEGRAEGKVEGRVEGEIQTLTYLITLPPDEMRKQALERFAKLKAENPNLENDQDLESDNDLEL